MGFKIGDTGLHLATSDFARFIPEPKSSPSVSFGGVVQTLAAAATQIVPGATGISGEYLDMINRQIEVQQQMQLVSLVSNIEKSKHETQMAAIRNVRAG